MNVQVPVPTRGVLPASVVVVDEQIVCEGPAEAVVGRALTFTNTVSSLAGHAPFVIFHLNK